MFSQAAMVCIDAHAIEAGAAPGRFRAFDDEGRGVGVELIGVRPDPAVFGFLEDEGEGVVEFLMGAEPDVFAGAHVDVGLENAGVARSHARIHAVGRHDEIEVAIGVEVLRLGFELQRHAKCAGALLQDVQQPLAPDAAEAVAGRGDDRIPIVHRDIVPIDEIFANEFRAFGVIGLQVAERLVGEHDAPAESVVRPVALDHDHLVRGIAPFQ